MSRKRYFLGPDGDGGWNLKAQGAQRATRNFERKADALEFSRSFVRSQQDSQLIVQRRDGVIQTEHTYGNDPKRYKG